MTINTEAKQAIKDLFPKIPDNDLYRIIKHAFQLSTARVGTAPELPLLRRAHLAVVAHIRHNYTSYDRLLKTVQYNEARHQVEQETLAIVISDEEESEADARDVQPLHQEQVRVEELSSSKHDRGYARSLSPVAEARLEQHQPYPRLIRTYRPTDAEIAQRNEARYARWDQARRDYRSRIAQNPPTVVERIHEPDPAQASRILIPVDPPTQPYRTEAPQLRAVRVEYEVSLSYHLVLDH